MERGSKYRCRFQESGDLRLRVTDEPRTTRGEYRAQGIDCTVQPAAQFEIVRFVHRQFRPTQVLVESMECHSLYQEERLRTSPCRYSCSILRLESRVKKNDQQTAGSTSNYLALLHFGTNFAILLPIISAKLMNN